MSARPLPRWPYICPAGQEPQRTLPRVVRKHTKKGILQRATGQIAALAGCDLLTISPDLLAQLAASDAPLPRALDAEAARQLDLPVVNYGADDEELSNKKHY